MTAFTVELKNQPGELAHLSDGCPEGQPRPLRNDAWRQRHGRLHRRRRGSGADGARECGIEFTKCPAFTVRMANVPGAGAATFRKLANASVNMDLLLPIRISDEVFFAVICVDDVDAARTALGDQLIDN